MQKFLPQRLFVRSATTENLHIPAKITFFRAVIYATRRRFLYFREYLDIFAKIQYTEIAVLGGELAVPCYPQSATAELNAN